VNAIPFRIGNATLWATPTTAAGLRLTARYLRMRRLFPALVPEHRADERLCLFLLRLALRAHHPELKTSGLLSLLARAKLTAADAVRLGARGLERRRR
jgi:hypothetical protein